MLTLFFTLIQGFISSVKEWPFGDSEGTALVPLYCFFSYSTWHLEVSMKQAGLCLLALSVALFHTASLWGFPLTTREHIVMKGWIKVAVIKENGHRQSSKHVSCDKWHQCEPECVRCPCSVCFSPPGCFSCPLAFIQNTQGPEHSAQAGGQGAGTTAMSSTWTACVLQETRVEQWVTNWN